MAIVTGQLFTQGGDSTTAIDTLLTQEANRIGPDIHKRTLHVSPWLDLIKQTVFPEGMGSTLGTLIYDRALPNTAKNDSADAGTLGVTWSPIADNAAASLETASTLNQIITGATDTNVGPGTGPAYIHFSRQFKQYHMRRATIESPRINVEDLRYAAFRTEQLRAIMDAMTEATRWTLEERYRDEYDRLCKTVVLCRNTAGATTFFTTNKEGAQTWSLDFGAAGDTPDANISNKIMDAIYFRKVRGGAGSSAYGRENARPVFAVVLSSEASYSLITESGFRDDYRYNNAKVGDLIAPLGVERSHRGFYHLVDDLAPRFTDDGDGTITRVQPYTMTNGIVADNSSYELATIEAAYVINSEVMESQIPSPNVSGPGVSFNPVDYKGKFSWKNIPHETLNPDGTIGFFRGVIATASKPIKTEFGYVVLFKRTASTFAI
jgi:hypothetical protein